MQWRDFGFFRHGKFIKALTQVDAHLLMPIDRRVTPQQDSALLLLHGFASSPAVYRAILPQIRGYDRIVCPVLPGHGESIQTFAQFTAQDWQEAATQHCATLIKEYARVSVIGLSLGGVLALGLSQMFPLHHLYLLAPALKLQYSAAYVLLAARLLHFVGWKTMANHAGNFYTDQYEELTYRRLPMQAIMEILAYIKTQQYPIPQCATDLFLGRYDNIVDSQTIARQYVQSPQVQIHWLEHSAHILPLDGDREIILQSINDFNRRQS